MSSDRPPGRVFDFEAWNKPRDRAEPLSVAEEKIRREHDAMQVRIEQQERIRLARDLLVHGRAATVADAFSIADAFGAEALRRVPHIPYDEATRAGAMGTNGWPFGVG